MLIQVYPKGHVQARVPVTQERARSDAWTAAVTRPWARVIRNRVRTLVERRPGVTFVGADLANGADTDIIGDDPGIVWFRFPKVVLTFDVPDATTHAHVVQAFTADGFAAWLKSRIRARVPAGVVLLSWSLTIKSELGRSTTEEPE